MSEQVKVEVFLDAEVVQWIDGINAQCGLRSRGGTINRLLLEIKRTYFKEDPETTA